MNPTYLIQSKLMHKVEIFSLNVKGLKADGLNLIKDLVSCETKNFIHKSDIDKFYSRGRPFGGQCWIFDKRFKLIDKRFLNKYISYINLKVFSFEVCFIGTYVHFDDSKNRNESKSNFESSLCLIWTLNNHFDDKNIPVIILGDFNADLNRNNRFDCLLKNFIIENNFLVIDTLNKSSYYTY